jgi:beta-glucosidase
VSVQTGTDLSCGHEYAALLDAIHEGLIDEATIDAAVKRLFTARLRLGMFDPFERVSYNKIPYSENDSTGHAALALRTARASIVLLKNDSAILPLKRSIRTLAVVGPNAASLAALEGNYNSVPSHPLTPLGALQARLPGRIRYAQGSAYVDGAPVPVPETVFRTRNDSIQPGLLGEYFNGSALSGRPVFRRVDRQVDFDWNGSAPAPGLSAKTFSVRWTGTLTPPAPVTIRFGFTMSHCSTCNDSESINVWLDGKLVHDFQHAATPGRRSTTPTFDLTFSDIRAHAIRIEYIHSAPLFGAGLTFNWQPPADVLRRQAVAAAAASDAVVAVLGLSPDLEGEEMPVQVDGFSGGDRSRIELPAVQQQLVSALAATGKPLVIVLLNGSALALQDAAKKASAVLEAWYPGQTGGTAITDTLFGGNNPSGRLPVTFYASTSQLPPFEDYSMNNRTYRYFTGQPLYSFGYGLSYTRFEYSDGSLSTTNLNAGAPIEVSVGVRNAGHYDGEETVEVYLIPKNIAGAPLRVLVGFEKVYLPRGATKTIRMEISPRELSLVSSVGSRSVRPGDYELFAGGGQPSTHCGIFLPFHIQGLSPIAP